MKAFVAGVIVSSVIWGTAGVIVYAKLDQRLKLEAQWLPFPIAVMSHLCDVHPDTRMAGMNACYARDRVKYISDRLYNYRGLAPPG